MAKIYKYGPFYPRQECKIWGSVKHFERQGMGLFVWSEVDGEPHPNSYDLYYIVATGQDYGNRKHYGTALDEYNQVWHLVR